MTNAAPDPEMKFAIGALKKVGLFLVIALAAVVLHIIVLVLEHYDFSALMTVPLSFLEYVIFFGDVLWLLRGLIIEIGEILGDLKNLWIRFGVGLVIFIVGVVLSPRLNTWYIELLRVIARLLPPAS
jgi:hypothetical protein